MSDLTATNCGCNNGCGSTFGNSCNWLMVYLMWVCMSMFPHYKKIPGKKFRAQTVVLFTVVSLLNAFYICGIF